MLTTSFKLSIAFFRINCQHLFLESAKFRWVMFPFVFLALKCWKQFLIKDFFLIIITSPRKGRQNSEESSKWFNAKILYFNSQLLASPPSRPSLHFLIWRKKFKYRLGEQAGMIHLFNFDGLLVQPSEQKWNKKYKNKNRWRFFAFN